jgi:hypothetical protein
VLAIVVKIKNMVINDRFKLNTMALPNFAANAAIGTASATVDVVSSVAIAQTTANILLTLPSPTDANLGALLSVYNTGTAAFKINNVVVEPTQLVVFWWNSSSWQLPKSHAANRYRIITATGTLTQDDDIVYINNNATAVIITLPNIDGKVFTIKRFSNASTGTITVRLATGTIQATTGAMGATTTILTTANNRSEQFQIINNAGTWLGLRLLK